MHLLQVLEMRQTYNNKYMSMKTVKSLRTEIRGKSQPRLNPKTTLRSGQEKRRLREIKKENRGINSRINSV